MKQINLKTFQSKVKSQLIKNLDAIKGGTGGDDDQGTQDIVGIDDIIDA